MWPDDSSFLPNRFGPAIGQADERVMLSRVGGQSGIRTGQQIAPDGSVTILKTGAGMARFVTEPASGKPFGYSFHTLQWGWAPSFSGEPTATGKLSLSEYQVSKSAGESPDGLLQLFDSPGDLPASTPPGNSKLSRVASFADSASDAAIDSWGTAPVGGATQASDPATGTIQSITATKAGGSVVFGNLIHGTRYREQKYRAWPNHHNLLKAATVTNDFTSITDSAEGIDRAYFDRPDAHLVEFPGLPAAPVDQDLADIGLGARTHAVLWGKDRNYDAWGKVKFGRNTHPYRAPDGTMFAITYSLTDRPDNFLWCDWFGTQTKTEELVVTARYYDPSKGGEEHEILRELVTVTLYAESLAGDQDKDLIFDNALFGEQYLGFNSSFSPDGSKLCVFASVFFIPNYRPSTPANSAYVIDLAPQLKDFGAWDARFSVGVVPAAWELSISDGAADSPPSCSLTAVDLPANAFGYNLAGIGRGELTQTGRPTTGETTRTDAMLCTYAGADTLHIFAKQQTKVSGVVQSSLLLDGDEIAAGVNPDPAFLTVSSNNTVTHFDRPNAQFNIYALTGSHSIVAPVPGDFLFPANYEAGLILAIKSPMSESLYAPDEIVRASPWVNWHPKTGEFNTDIGSHQL